MWRQRAGAKGSLASRPGALPLPCQFTQALTPRRNAVSPRPQTSRARHHHLPATPPLHYSRGVTATRSRVLVAVHDVTPAHAGRLDVLYRLLEEFGIRQYALLVVPDWHGAWPLDA